MFGLKLSEVDKEVLMIFVICYEYSISFSNMLKLFNISRKYFWIFMEVCAPMLKMGVRKASCLRKTVNKILNCLKTIPYSYKGFTTREEVIFEAFLLYLETSFSDGEACLALPQLKAMPFVEGFSNKGYLMATTFDDLVKNIDRIDYITLGKDIYHKTSSLMYFMSKYRGDMSVKELRSLSVKDVLRIISEEQEKSY